MSDPNPTSKPRRRLPPLMWLFIAALVGCFILILVQRGGVHTTPGGGTMPMAERGTAVMPPAPATGGAPATPGSVQNAGDPSQ